VLQALDLIKEVLLPPSSDSGYWAPPEECSGHYWAD